MFCNSYNSTGLGQVLIGQPSILPKVKSITHDFSALFNKLCDRLFCDTVQVGHKFNIIRHMMEANQAIRIRIRQKELQKRREAFNEFKWGEKLRLDECECGVKEFKPWKFHYKETRLENRETPLELLTRCRHLLFSSPINGSPNRR